MEHLPLELFVIEGVVSGRRDLFVLFLRYHGEELVHVLFRTFLHMQRGYLTVVDSSLL